MIPFSLTLPEAVKIQAAENWGATEARGRPLPPSIKFIHSSPPPNFPPPLTGEGTGGGDYRRIQLVQVAEGICGRKKGFQFEFSGKTYGSLIFL
jgi:hypothetical protein